jgi:hypothetical protein
VLTFQRLLAAAEKFGPVTVLPEKTRIAFQVRMSFAAFTLRRRWIDGHVVLARRLDSPRFRRIDFISPRNQVHLFRLTQPTEVDAKVERWLAKPIRWASSATSRQGARQVIERKEVEDALLRDARPARHPDAHRHVGELDRSVRIGVDREGAAALEGQPGQLGR